MRLNHGWFALFDDTLQRVACRKKVHLSATGNTYRHVVLEWRPPYLTRVNKDTGVATVAGYDRLPPDVQAVLEAKCAKRWLSSS